MEQDDQGSQQSAKVDKNLARREQNVRRSIANTVEAVSTIVSHSTDDEFRQKCFSLMEVPNSSGLATRLTSQLQSIAQHHMGVTWSAKDSPELSQKLSVPRLSTSQSTSSQLQDSQLTLSLPTHSDSVDLNTDDFSEFSEVGFLEEEETAGLPEMSQPGPAPEGSAPLTTTLPSNPVEAMLSSAENEWFDEVLNSDLFVHEN